MTLLNGGSGGAQEKPPRAAPPRKLIPGYLRKHNEVRSVSPLNYTLGSGAAVGIRRAATGGVVGRGGDLLCSGQHVCGVSAL